MGKIKIVEFIWGLYDGGAETLVVNHAGQLKKDGFDVTILTFCNITDSANYKRAKDRGINVVCLYNSYNILAKAWIHSFGYMFDIARRFSKYVDDNDVDVIHMHLEVLQFAKQAKKVLKGKKLFYTCHSKPQECFCEALKGQLESAKFLIQNFNMRLVALHDEMKEQLNVMFDVQNTVVINNAIDIDDYTNIKESRQDIRKTLAIKEDSFVIGHIGRCSAEKNHDFLFKIFECELSKNPNAHLLCISSEELQKKIDGLSFKDKITFLTKRDDIPRLLKAMDVFVLPSTFEGLPIVLIEAQSAGLRCIVSDAVTSGVSISENMVFCSLNEEPLKWCGLINDSSIKGKAVKKARDFDLKVQIRTLEDLYCN